MHSYSLAADSSHWWWLPATAGVLGTAAVTAILAIPTSGAAPPIYLPTYGVGDLATGPVTVIERPCYLARGDWNTVAGWEQPVCTTQTGGRSEPALPGVRWRTPDYLP